LIWINKSSSLAPNTAPFNKPQAKKAGWELEKTENDRTGAAAPVGVFLLFTLSVFLAGA
jgi:hypothetical protein